MYLCCVWVWLIALWVATVYSEWEASTSPPGTLLTSTKRLHSTVVRHTITNYTHTHTLLPPSTHHHPHTCTHPLPPHSMQKAPKARPGIDGLLVSLIVDHVMNECTYKSNIINTITIVHNYYDLSITTVYFTHCLWKHITEGEGWFTMMHAVLKPDLNWITSGLF